MLGSSAARISRLALHAFEELLKPPLLGVRQERRSHARNRGGESQHEIAKRRVSSAIFAASSTTAAYFHRPSKPASMSIIRRLASIAA